MNRILTVTASLLILMHVAARSEASDYALAMAGFIEGKCSVVIWIHEDGKSNKVEYHADIDDNRCSVYVPVATFEKNFKYCVLSGISVSSVNKPFYAIFGGGPAGDREVYWFEWKPGRYVHPNFFCFLR